MDANERSAAFGAPGIEPRWTSSAKEEHLQFLITEVVDKSLLGNRSEIPHRNGAGF
jgi:hypothetical protein